MVYAAILLSLCFGGAAAANGFYPPMDETYAGNFAAGAGYGPFFADDAFAYAGAYAGSFGGAYADQFYAPPPPTTTPKPTSRCSYYCYRVNNQISNAIIGIGDYDRSLCNSNVMVICSPTVTCPPVRPAGYGQSTPSSSTQRPLCPTFLCRIGDKACSVSRCRLLSA